MPGIAGFISHIRQDRQETLLNQMVQSMVHEPFHTSGYQLCAQLGVGIGWVALGNSFSDCMPIWNERKDVCLIYSGEDYRDPAEIETLRARGHSFDRGNASYLVHLYEELEDRFFVTLNGRFHGLVMDLRNKSVVLFNDRYGLNRLYFREDTNGLFFASEAKAILHAFPESRQLDIIGLAELFSGGCALENRTLFDGISLLPGGSAWITSQTNPLIKRRYFEPLVWEDQFPLESGEYYTQFKSTWSRILPRYLRGKEPVAVSLTGGKDSRMMMAWTGAQPGELPCYTFGGMYHECADVKLARTVARLCRQPHSLITLDKSFLKEFPSEAERTVYITDGAMDVSGAADLYVNRIARTIAPIRLTGNYGQEMLRGAIALKPEPQAEQIFERDFGTLVRGAVHTYRHSLTKNPMTFAAFKQLSWFHYCRLSLELSQVTLRSPYLDNDLIALAFRAPRATATPVEMQLRLIAEGNRELGRLGTDRGLLYDRTPILTRIERLYQEFTFKAEYAYDYGMPHWLARFDNLVRPLHLERLFLGRHKFHHFRVWYRDELSGYIKEMILDPRTRKRPYFNGRQLERMVKAHITGTGNYTSEIHRVLTSELIQRQLID